MSRLDSNVRSIDFNNCCQTVKKEEKEEYGMVSIHKRERTSPTSSSSSSELAKKKRFKLAPLGTPNVPAPSLPSTSSMQQEMEKEVPTDRGELLKLVRYLSTVNFSLNIKYFLAD